MTRGIGRVVLFLAGAVLTQSALALSLSEAWDGAKRADREFAASYAEFEAGAKRRDQARALWLPAVNASATTGRATSNATTRDAGFSAPGFGTSRNVEFQTSVNNGTLNRWSVNAVQPIYNREKLAQSHQLEASANAADAGWIVARQAALLRTAERYFAVVQAQTALNLARNQQVAVDRALSEAKERYRLGDKPIVDSHEATARAEAVRAQVYLAESELVLQTQAFVDQTGREPSDLWSPGKIEMFHPGSLDTWLQKTVTAGPMLRMLDAKLTAAREEVGRYSVAASPTVDLVAQSGRERLAGSGDYGNSAMNEMGSSVVGIQLNIPIFTGGMRNARHEEAIKLAEKTQYENERARQQVEHSTRAAWLGVTVGTSRVQALEANVKASLARLEATRLGHKVGDRTMLDLLNAENDASTAQLELLKARIAVILDRMRLAATSGELDEDVLEVISRESMAKQ